MAEHDRTVDGTGRRRDPAAGDARVEELVGRRAVVPHGDRVDRAESRRVEHDEGVASAHDHVVRVLVLHDDVDHVTRPAQHLLERLHPRCDREQVLHMGTVPCATIPAVRVVLALAMLSACVREPDPEVCPTLARGQLVITEIHGDPSPDDGTKPWIELFNASGSGTDLFGTRIRFRKLDGSSEVDVLVRRSLPAPAGSYTVLGLDNDASLPAYMDYGFDVDYKVSWLSGAAVQVETCGALIDRADYSSLPNTGTFSLGTMPPDADMNDIAMSWCTDPAANGTPKAANKPCP
jgi:hypothetical protein